MQYAVVGRYCAGCRYGHGPATGPTSTTSRAASCACSELQYVLQKPSGQVTGGLLIFGLLQANLGDGVLRLRLSEAFTRTRS
jgi:hypothetical protein